MARYVADIESKLAPEEAFAYMADFSNARHWDPSVSKAERVGDGTFELVAKFGGKDVPLRYTAIEHDPPRLVVLEAARPGFVSRDTITVSPAPGGSIVHYDALLQFGGARKLLDPLMQLVFSRVGAKAKAGLETALNP
ncbi:MAG TPA: SRPBCC family protein [Gaiellaceae bacterium]|nr:SRPBCC family protein [Gaiellaceae bacterium]